MMTIDGIREQITGLFKSGRRIHITAQVGSPKSVLSNVPARITGVYPRLFIIEESSSGTAKTHTFKYTDIITGITTVKEVEI